MKSVVLTGVSGGMGLATAKRLILDGYTVFGLDVKVPAESIDNLVFLPCDLRDSVSMAKAFQAVSEKTKEIDAIVSMAGIYDLNSLIEMSEEDFLRIFDINVFAAFRLNRTFVPLLKDGGKVIIVSSELAPLDPLPFTGIYAITKAALEKYADALRMELQLINKRVVVIRPGAVATSLLDVSTARLDAFVAGTQHYSCNATRFRNIVNRVESRKVPPEKIGALIAKVMAKKKPRFVYKINRNPLLLLLNILPKRTQNWIIKQILRPKKK